MLSRSLLSTIAVCIVCFGHGLVFAQAYPNRPVHIMTGEIGGGLDIPSRLIAQGIAGSLGQQVVVDNRPAILANELGAKAAPDGYTLLLNSSSLWLLPLMQSAPYDPVKDYAPITAVTRAPLILVVHPSLPVKSVRELIALAKSKPGALNYATGSTGSPTHLAPEIFKSMAAINMVRIPYKGTGPAINALVAGEVQLMISTPGGAAALVKSSRLKALAVTSAKRSTLFPEMPALAESLPGYESVSMAGLFAPAKTPEAIIRRLNQEIAQVLNGAEVKEKLLSIGVEAAPSSPEEWAAFIKTEMTQAGSVIKADLRK